MLLFLLLEMTIATVVFVYYSKEDGISLLPLFTDALVVADSKIDNSSLKFASFFAIRHITIFLIKG